MNTKVKVVESESVNGHRRTKIKMKWIIFTAILVALIGATFVKRSTNNVCKTFGDYYSDRDKNENCYYNPDFDLPLSEVIRKHGYPVETHHVTTKDGYILTMFRIPHGKDPDNKKARKPVLLQHGMGANGACFLVRGNKSLGLNLADEGYDVWVGNFRGTSYSPNHTSLSSSDNKFWNFSFHEHGLYDVPAQLELINKLTKQKITYIGHSMGTTAMYIYGVVHPDEAYDKVDLFISLAPAVYMKDVKTILSYGFPFWNLIQPVLNALFNGRLTGGPPIPDWLFDQACLPYPFQFDLCTIHNKILGGFNSAQDDPETYPINMKRMLDFFSIKAISHYIQISQSDIFKSYNYGTEDNKRMYGQSEPPVYDLSKLKIPNHMIRADNDLLITKENVEKLYDALPDRAKLEGIYVIKDKYFTHLDFVTARDVGPLLNDYIVNFLRRQ